MGKKGSQENNNRYEQTNNRKGPNATKSQKTITEIRDQMRGNAQQPDKTQEMEEQMTDQHTIHMITDSNGKRITPHLKENNNRVNITKTYRTEDINENIHTDKTRIKNADTVIMMVGTSNIREGEEAKENRKRISEAIDNLAEIRGTYANIITIKPPPIIHRRKAREIEMAILGSQIEDMADRMGVELIDNKKLIQEMDEDTDTILEHDGYHITKTAGAIIANEIQDSIEKRGSNTRKDSRQPRDTNTPRTGKTESGEMYIDADMTRHIIGHKGKLIKEIEEATDTRIKTEDNRDRTKTILTITATKTEYIEEAQYLIESKINEVMSFNREKDRHVDRNTICDFYLRGNCRNGKTCYYKHEEDTKRREITWGKNEKGNDRGRTKEREHRPIERSNTRTETRDFRDKMREQRSRSRSRTVHT